MSFNNEDRKISKTISVSWVFIGTVEVENMCHTEQKWECNQTNLGSILFGPRLSFLIWFYKLRTSLIEVKSIKSRIPVFTTKK